MLVKGIRHKRTAGVFRMRVVLLGAPNSGKGTISAMLSEHYNVPHLSTGNMFRQLAEEGSKLGLEAKEKYWTKGKLVPEGIHNGWFSKNR